MHIKRQNISKFWPLHPKGNKYVVVPNRERKNGVPILVILRDILKLAENRKEVKKIINCGKIKINDKIIRKDNFTVMPFDIVDIGEKTYIASFSEKGKFQLQETKEREKISKIIDKKIIKGNKIQINLLYGKNILIKDKIKANVGDSVIIKDNKIQKIIPIEKTRKVMMISGKNTGKIGIIDSINKNIIMVSIGDKKIKTKIKDFIVLK
jgi:small subunit ribosomal protein S4e